MRAEEAHYHLWYPHQREKTRLSRSHAWFVTTTIYLLSESNLRLAHELRHWYHMHPTKLLCISQIHIFSILVLFPAFLHAPQFLRLWFTAAVAPRPPTIIAFLLFQVHTHRAYMLFQPLLTVCFRGSWHSDGHGVQLYFTALWMEGRLICMWAPGSSWGLWNGGYGWQTQMCPCHTAC